MTRTKVTVREGGFLLSQNGKEPLLYLGEIVMLTAKLVTSQTNIMKKHILTVLLTVGILASTSISAIAQEEQKAKPELTLITKTPEEGFQLAVTLARKGVTTIQTDKKILFEQREVYAKDAEFLIAASQVIAIHFQTVAAANNYWQAKN